MSTIVANLEKHKFYVSAGLPRSGSTWLFNVLREVLYVKYGSRLYSFWEEDLESTPANAVILVKTHTLNSYYTQYAQKSFFTYRDIRTVAVSNFRMFQQTISMASIRAYMREFVIAQNTCDMLIRYEDLREWPIDVIKNIAQHLRIEVDAEDIHKEVASLKPPTGSTYSKKTLLHPYHFTHTGDKDWHELIPQELQQQIHKEYRWWFKEFNYPME